MGEWIASKVFDIQLEDSAVAKAIDGRFRSGPLAGKTVNIKIYGKREGLLDTNSDPTLAKGQCPTLFGATLWTRASARSSAGQPLPGTSGMARS